MVVVRCLVLVLLFASALIANAQTIYKSTGPGGVPVYSDDPPVSGKIEKVITIVELPSSPLPQAPQSDPRAYPNQPRNQPARPNPDGVVLFTASWCGYCKQAKAWLARKQVAYREVDIESPHGRALFAQAGGRGGVPLLTAGARRVSGFSQAGYDAFFSSR